MGVSRSCWQIIRRVIYIRESGQGIRFLGTVQGPYDGLPDLKFHRTVEGFSIKQRQIEYFPNDEAAEDPIQL